MRCSLKLSCGHRCPSVCGEICPSKQFCQECASNGVKETVVDFISFGAYSEQDLDADPILVLPCKHFFSMSSLDGHLCLNQVYQVHGDRFIAPLPLLGNDVSEKSKECPTCRVNIHSVRRYSRMTKLATLRALERKHMMKIDESLQGLANRDPAKRPLAALKNLLKMIRFGPMKQISDASGSSEVPTPPSAPSIKCLHLLGEAYGAKAIGNDKEAEYVNKSADSFREAISVADKSKSIRSGAIVRNSMARVLMRWKDNNPSLRSELADQIQWVLKQGILSNDVIEESKLLAQELEKNDISDVIKAMNTISGYDYGGGSDSHWFECPNGHPYFIGECGGAMQSSRCIECGATVGGSSHQLTTGNRRWGGFADAMNS